MRKALSDINYLEKTYREAGVGLVDAAAEHIAVIDVQEDVEDFVESHVGCDWRLCLKVGS